MNSTRSQRKKRIHCSSSVFRLLSALLLFTQWLTNCLFVIFFFSFSFSFFFLLQILPSTVPLFSRLSLCLCLLSASDPALFFFCRGFPLLLFPSSFSLSLFLSSIHLSSFPAILPSFHLLTASCLRFFFLRSPHVVSGGSGPPRLPFQTDSHPVRS